MFHRRGRFTQVAALCPPAGGGGGGDPDFASVVLLCGFEGANGSTVLVDESSAPHTISPINQTQISTAQFKFGTSSVLFDGVGDHASIPDSADWTLSSANSDQFTVELFIRRTATGDDFIIGQENTFGGASASNAWMMYIFSGGLYFEFNTPGGVVVTVGAVTTLSANVWYHVAADKDATGKIRTYKDGVMIASATPASSAIRSVTTALTIGATASVNADYPGYMDEIRITKGVARYASDGGFTVPTAAFPRS